MSLIFNRGVITESRQWVQEYTKKHEGKTYSGISIEGNKLCYPYDLVHKIGIENFDSIPPLLYIQGKINCKIKLKDYQEACMGQLIDYPYGIFVSAPGTGKTVMTLWLIAQLKLRTLILVNSTFLLRQWEEECIRFLEYTPGIIGDGTFTINDITIATFQSARKQERLDQIKDKFSLVIVDECHRVPANTFRNVLNSIIAYYKLGITGTPKRKDGLEFIGKWLLGSKVLVNEYDDTMVPEIVLVKTGIKLPEADGYVECLNMMEEDSKLIKLIKKNIDASNNRHHLILSFRLTTVDLLTQEFPEALVVTGHTSKEDRKDLNEKVKDSKIIITTTLQEGANIPNLDTLHLIHPNNNLPMLEQRIKRINRPLDNKKVPLVFDYWYTQGKCKGFSVQHQQMKRLAFYNNKGYKVHVISTY